MQAWVLVEHGKDLQKQQLPTPEPSGGEVLVKVSHCGLCHSDLHFWEGFYELGGGKRLYMKDRGRTLPQVIGHEVAGVVERVGPDVQGVAPGRKVIVYPWIGCGNCSRCAAGEDNMCTAQGSIGIARSGGYGEYVLVPDAKYLVEPGDLDPAVAATYTCSGITVYAAIKKHFPLRPEQPFVLIGAGGLGLNAVAILVALGHRNVVVVDKSEQNRAKALELGAAKAVEPGESGIGAAITHACGGPVDAIIDFVNSTETATGGFEALRKGGKLVLVGLYGGDITLALPFVVTKAVTIQGSLTGTIDDLRELVELARGGKLPALPVELVGRSDVNDAMARLREGRVTGRLILVGD